MRRHDIKPGLTESMLLKNVERTIETMNALKGSGIQFSLNDFSFSYSSLQYLNRPSLDQVKTDKLFVCDIASDSSGPIIGWAKVHATHL